MTANTASTAATWAGYTNTTFAGPTLELTTVPEPASLLLVGSLAMLLAGGTRRRN